MKQIICRKCAGKGTIHNFKHVEGGICFTCQGSGIEEVADNTTDIVKEIRENRKKEKETEKQFDLLYNDNKMNMPRDWNNYIMGITGIENKFNRLQNYISYKIEMKERVSKEININDADFETKFQNLINELENKYMIEEE